MSNEMDCSNNNCDYFANYFEQNIPDDASVIEVKINKLDISENAMQGCKEKVSIYAISQYIKDLGVEILFASFGVHLKGKNKVPHAHWHFITTPLAKKPSNPSQHRQRWENKNEQLGVFEDHSFIYHTKIDLTKPKYQILSYPLKEGIRADYHQKSFYINLKKQEIDFLELIGRSIYDNELALNLRREKCEERKKLALTDLHRICAENISKFSNFREMCLFLDENFINNLELGDYPDPRNYKTNLQKIAVNLKLLKYSDLL